MLELALELQETINRYVALDKMYKLNPSEQEWKKVKELVVCLKVFYDATLKLSDTKYPTLNLLFPEFCEVYLSIKKIESSSYLFIVKMGTKMLAKWDKYWSSGNTLLAIVCVIDPRCKLAVIEYYIQQMYTNECAWFIANLKNYINELFQEYADAHSKLVRNQPGSSAQHLRYNTKHEFYLFILELQLSSVSSAR
jgi:Domain of unknown function (DUF4413)